MPHLTRPDPTSVAAPGLVPLITGFMASRAVLVAAELGIADLLAEGTQSSEALAEKTQTDPPSLHRLLRGLASFGLLDEVEPGRFALTAQGFALCSGTAGSLRNLAMMFGSERSWHAHPDQATIFDAAMAEITSHVASAVAAAYDFSRFHSPVDVGGGNGTLSSPRSSQRGQLGPESRVLQPSVTVRRRGS